MSIIHADTHYIKKYNNSITLAISITLKHLLEKYFSNEESNIISIKKTNDIDILSQKKIS
ncbi:hypothetical protein [Desulfurella sp.]|uniref:hypothetical protein n=1 Tax=Desulfurella sp. TaxID=1962857 RepID=UPI0025BC9480|nr:hypothetical protein [Desulfurella sp.]